MSHPNLYPLRDVSRSELFALLDSIEGTKSMVWDQKLIGPFGLISDYGLLKEHKVIQMLELRRNKLPNINGQNLIYFIRPELTFIDIIVENIKPEINQRLQNINLHLIFVPRTCVLCERKLQALGVFGNFTTITGYSPDFFVLDSDVLSLEWPVSFRECQLETDYSSLYQSAHSLMTLQCLYGIIPSITGIGRSSKIVYDLLVRMRRETSGIEPSIVPQIDHMLLIDRSVDLLSPMTVQLSYEGLLDEIFGINQTVIELPPEKFSQSNSDNSSGPQTSQSVEPPTEKKRLYLKSTEDLFKKLRDSNYQNVGPILRSTAKSLVAQFDERKFAKTVREIRQFVDKIPILQKQRTSQANHTSMAELIHEVTNTEEFHDMLECENEFLTEFETESVNAYIETCISRNEDLTKILRLIAIQSICGNGLKQKVLDFYKREIVQTYGYEHMITLHALEQSGVFRVSGGTAWSGRSYSMVRNRLKLTWNLTGNGGKGANANNSPEIGHVHHGYTPLSVRIVQHLDQFGFRSLADVLTRHLLKQDVPIFDEIQQLPSALRKRRNSDTTSLQSAAEMNQKVVLIFFLGGCTFAEISSLRLLSNKDGVNSDFIVATTSIINGRTFLQSLTPVSIGS